MDQGEHARGQAHFGMNSCSSLGGDSHACPYLKSRELGVQLLERSCLQSIAVGPDDRDQRVVKDPYSDVCSPLPLAEEVRRELGFRISCAAGIEDGAVRRFLKGHAGRPSRCPPSVHDETIEDHLRPCNVLFLGPSPWLRFPWYGKSYRAAGRLWRRRTIRSPGSCCGRSFPRPIQRANSTRSFSP